MDLPTSPKRCLAIAMLRVVSLRQKDTAKITKCANQTVVDVERWFKEEDYHRVARICDDQSIKKMVAAEAIYWGLEEETLVKLDRLTQDDILRHYRKTDYIERRDPMLRKYFMEWREQYNCPPPELIFLDNLGRIGDNTAPLKQDILTIALEGLRFSIRITQTTWHPNYTYTGGDIFWELPLKGLPKLWCPVERQPRFHELLARLSDHGRQCFGKWKSLGGYLEACMHVKRVIHDQAKSRAGGLVAVDSIFEKIRADLTLPPGPRLPSHLNVEFGDLIYSLSIECCRSPNVLDIVKGLYHTRPKGLLVDLLFGRYEPPLATGLPGEIEHCAHLHQLMVEEFGQSEMINRLIEEHEQILSLEEVVRGELDKIIESFLPQ